MRESWLGYHGGRTERTSLPDLVILSGSRAGAVFTLPDVPTVIGRSPEAHLQIEDPWISSMHAMFERRGDAVWVVDLESRNGTFVGDERITEARLAIGMVLRFGRTEVRVAEGVRAPEPAEEEPAPDRARVESPTEPRARPDPQRSTLRGDLADPALFPARVEVDRVDPTALVTRPAAVLRLALHATGRGRPPDALALRAAVDAVERAATNEGAVVARLAGAGALALFGMSGPAPSADDTVRALRAARTARSAVQAFGAGLELRAAVDRGPVLAAALAAGAMVAVACIRSANRHYHLIHPELHLDTSTPVLVVWTTLLAGVTGAGWHFLGWALVLVGSIGWTSRRLPRLLCGLYWVGGIVPLFVYVLPDLEEIAGALGVVMSIWQGILLWKAEPGEIQAPAINANQPDQP